MRVANAEIKLEPAEVDPDDMDKMQPFGSWELVTEGCSGGEMLSIHLGVEPGAVARKRAAAIIGHLRQALLP